jgi:anti-sigma-K factor RskA
MPRLDRYQQPEVYEALAGDYVLGTMGGRARLRFAALMAERVYIQQAVAAWERRLNPLGSRAPAVTPHPRVWRKIQREIAADRRQRARASWWQSLPLWRATAFAALIALGGLLTYEAVAPPQAVVPLPSYVAVLVDESQAPMIVATATRQPQRLVILKMQDPKLEPDQDLELWAIPEAGGAPISMGVLSEKQEILMELDERYMRLIPRTGLLAISREPKGGSPTGSPTGPVLYQGKLVTL